MLWLNEVRAESSKNYQYTKYKVSATEVILINLVTSVLMLPNNSFSFPAEKFLNQKYFSKYYLLYPPLILYPYEQLNIFNFWLREATYRDPSGNYYQSDN